MKLQVAMDVPSLADALTLARQVADYVDILELGTPLIKNAGLAAVAAIKAAHPDKLVFADLKTADAGELEADLAFAQGADLVTVMGALDDDTIKGAVDAGHNAGKKVVADMIGVVNNRVQRIQEVSKLGVDFVEIHAGLDEQARPGLLDRDPARRRPRGRRPVLHRRRRLRRHHRLGQGSRRGGGGGRRVDLQLRRPRGRREGAPGGGRPPGGDVGRTHPRRRVIEQ